MILSFGGQSRLELKKKKKKKKNYICFGKLNNDFKVNTISWSVGRGLRCEWDLEEGFAQTIKVHTGYGKDMVS
jgi:hypothetical protein